MHQTREVLAFDIDRFVFQVRDKVSEVFQEHCRLHPRRKDRQIRIVREQIAFGDERHNQYSMAALRMDEFDQRHPMNEVDHDRLIQTMHRSLD
jgi:hypothetical protein